MNEDRPSVRSLLEKSGRSLPASAPLTVPAADDTEAEYSAYAQGRISRHTQLSLMFRQADGAVRVFAYAYLCGAESPNPPTGFVLDFSRYKVKVTGRNLETLLRLVCQHRVAEIREAQRNEALAASPESPVVEAIQIVAPKIIEASYQPR